MNLHELFTYNPLTGDLVWRTRPIDHFANERSCRLSNSKYAGRVAGCLQRSGKDRLYRVVRIGDKVVAAHSIIWEMHHGPIPEGMEIDHIDNNSQSNLITNLRIVTHAQNALNRRTRSDNRLGIKGVNERKGRYTARITIGGRLRQLGTFDTPELAHEAYCKASAHHHGEFGRTA